MAVEEPEFTVEKRDGHFEIRRYAVMVVAETVVSGGFEDSGNRGFGPLFRYISGANREKSKIPMTAPVAQTRRGRKIPMTAPVAQAAASGGGWAVQFVMPAGATLENTPEPSESAVSLKAIPARRVAVVRYVGSWSAARYQRHLALLRTWMQDNALKAGDEPVWARYNPPFTPWFLRRNEIWIPLGEE
jgi:hypothetical protein